jgi:2-amino-4-hydroxy-6-hydroxymethyldihydropteridine diphosphokinase
MSVQAEENMACFSLGSNLGDRVKYLDSARMLMAERMGKVESVSGIYESPSWGYASDHSYYNCCVVIRTGLSPLALIDLALEVEREMGRNREGGNYADRIIDIDLLLYGDKVMVHPRLRLPHPRMGERRFVLVPLAEIAPDLVHPGSGLSIARMLERCQDPSEVSPV